MSRRFEGKVAIVTGAGSGIGEATAKRLAHEGAHVVCNTISGSGLQVVNKINELGGSALFVQGDVSAESTILEIIRSAMDAFGKIDCVYNNAAITGNNDLVTEYPLELWDRVFAVNVTSQFLMMKHVIPHMTSGGSILNCSSLHGTKGMAGDSAYSASKHAIIGLTRSVALEFGPQNIRVNCLGPGPIPTPTLERYESLLSDDVSAVKAQIAAGAPLKRYGTVEEVAAIATFLLSDEASYCNGNFYPVEGGYSAV